MNKNGDQRPLKSTSDKDIVRSKQKANVLIVDDRYENLVAMAKVLKPLDISLIKANSGNEAVAYALEYEFAVILLDVQMPEMDGFETASLLRENEKSRHVPIIFVTAISKEPRNVFEGYESGAVDYLFKPIDGKILRSKVSVFVDLYNANHNQLKELIVELEKAKLKLERNNLELEVLARKDTLTRLPNRLLFEETACRTIANCERKNRQFSLLIFDLDNFKIINDTLGHYVGDLLLKEVAKRLTYSVRAEDFIARLGGDEFAILLTDIKDYYLAGKIANKIIKEIQQVFKINKKELHVSASIGIACYPDAGKSITELMKHADVALYQAKKQGRNCASHFTPVLNIKYQRRAEIESGLHTAISNNELHLVYQPIFNIKSKEVVGMEALLRWNHPTLGIVPPDEFITISEEIGLANQLGAWVLENSYKKFADWHKKHGMNLRYAVNLSVCQLLQVDLLSSMTCLHKKYNIPTSQLVLEITETALMYQEEKALSLLEDLDKLGFQISIDDFGTGYSSLSRLQQMPINILKIDRTFISNVKLESDVVIAKAIINLAKNLNLGVVAEGVETKIQERFLLENNCNIAQGFMYSKPIKSNDMTVLLDKQFSTLKGKL